MKRVVILEKSEIAAALLCAGKQDIRYYLNGLLLEVGPNESRLVGTNGHIMGIVRIPQRFYKTDGIEEYIIPRDALESFKPTTKGSTTVTLTINEDSKGGVLSDPKDGIERSFTFVDGKFPDYRRTVPRKLGGKPGQFNPIYFADFAKVSKLLGGNGFVISHNDSNSPALITISKCPNFVGVLMPWREDPVEAAPAWCFSPDLVTPREEPQTEEDVVSV